MPVQEWRRDSALEKLANICSRRCRKLQVVAVINQGKRTVLAYLLSPVPKAVSEAGREL